MAHAHGKAQVSMLHVRSSDEIYSVGRDGMVLELKLAPSASLVSTSEASQNLPSLALKRSHRSQQVTQPHSISVDQVFFSFVFFTILQTPGCSKSYPICLALVLLSWHFKNVFLGRAIFV